jgi:hypothetical protein
MYEEPKLLPESCMKIDENLVNKEKKRVYAKSYRHTFYLNGISDDDLFFSSIFTPRASGMASPLSAPLCGMKHLILLC